MRGRIGASQSVELILVLVSVITLPLLGAWSAGYDLAPLFTFPPPLAVPRTFPRFSWLAVGVVVTPFVALTGAWLRRPPDGAKLNAATDGEATGVVPSPGRRFPSWGRIAALWTIGWWILAWSRFEWFGPLQRFTYFPLWLGFIVTTNAASVARKGECLMTRQTGRWVALFGFSAAFWWLFEWLNRFTHNWHYLGVADFGGVTYAVHATVCFSTVLPAVAAVAELLTTASRWQRRAAHGPAFTWLRRPFSAALLIGGGAIGLIGAGAHPWYFYPALWAAPLALLLGESILRGEPDIAVRVSHGDWRVPVTWAGAALLCGVFWELWNYHSAAHWIYTVPFVDRWHVFEMPALGYLGYLPFGLECYFIIARCIGDDVLLFSSASST